MERDASEREAFVRDATVDDHVRAELLSLLAWEDGATAGPFAWPGDTEQGDHAPPRDQLLDATLGPWRIVGRIGQGGMGVVYRALRADAAFERDVALNGTRPLLAAS